MASKTLIFRASENYTEEYSLSEESSPHNNALHNWSRYSIFNQLINIIEKGLWFGKLKRLTLAEQHKLAESKVLKLLQTDAFQSEQAAIQKIPSVMTNSKLRKVAPVIDSDGLIRAKGRLKQSKLPSD